MKWHILHFFNSMFQIYLGLKTRCEFFYLIAMVFAIQSIYFLLLEWKDEAAK